MTPDELYARAVEVMAESLGEHQQADEVWNCICGWTNPEPYESHRLTKLSTFIRHQSAMALDALLAAHTDEECGKCGGRGYILRRDVRGEGYREPCSAGCVDGRIRGERVIVTLTMERVGSYAAEDSINKPAIRLATYDGVRMMRGPWRAVYVERLPVDQEP